MATSNVTTKTCGHKEKCVHPLGADQPATNEHFANDKSKPDGLSTVCKACRKVYKAGWYASNRQHAIDYSTQWVNGHYADRLAYNREWAAQNPAKIQQYKQASYDKHRDEINTRTAQWKRDNPDKVAAEQAVMIAVRRGDIPKAHSLACQKCGNKAKHYHHWSYAPEHQLDVIPLCVPCHKEIHANMEVIE